MKNYILEILNNYISEDMKEKIDNNYEKYRSYYLSELGVDSLDIMGVVLEIESQFNLDINFDNFDIKQIETVQKLHNYLYMLKRNDDYNGN